MACDLSAEVSFFWVTLGRRRRQELGETYDCGVLALSRMLEYGVVVEYDCGSAVSMLSS